MGPASPGCWEAARQPAKDSKDVSAGMSLCTRLPGMNRHVARSREFHTSKHPAAGALNCPPGYLERLENRVAARKAVMDAPLQLGRTITARGDTNIGTTPPGNHEKLDLSEI